MTVDQIARDDQALLSELVRQAGWRAYEKGWQLLAYKNTLLGLQEAYPWAKNAFSPGWRVVSRWTQLEPSTPHSPLPLKVLWPAAAREHPFSLASSHSAVPPDFDRCTKTKLLSDSAARYAWK